jgi:hypothetical protein
MASIAPDIPQPLRDSVDRILRRGEILLRLEQPDPARFRRGLAWASIAIGLLFAIFTTITLMEGTWSFAALYAIFAAAFLTGPLQLRRAARNTAYAVTSERVVIVRRGIGGKLDARTFDGDMLRPRAVRHGRGPGGDVELIEGYRSGDGREAVWLQFVGLRDVEATEAALHQLIQSSSKSSL